MCVVLLVCPQVKTAYVNFVNHCYVDTEVEMKEIYTSNHMWKLFENFLVDTCRVRPPRGDGAPQRGRGPQRGPNPNPNPEPNV